VRKILICLHTFEQKRVRGTHWAARDTLLHTKNACCSGKFTIPGISCSLDCVKAVGSLPKWRHQVPTYRFKDLCSKPVLPSRGRDWQGPRSDLEGFEPTNAFEKKNGGKNRKIKPSFRSQEATYAFFFFRVIDHQKNK
jgi:hypothetical protein